MSAAELATFFIRPVGSEEMPAEMRGLDAVRGKTQRWFDNNEVHSAEVVGRRASECR